MKGRYWAVAGALAVLGAILYGMLFLRTGMPNGNETISQDKAEAIAAQALRDAGFTSRSVDERALDEGVWTFGFHVEEQISGSVVYVYVDAATGDVLDIDDGSIPPNPAGAADWVIFEREGNVKLYASGKAEFSRYERTVTISRRDLTGIRWILRTLITMECPSAAASERYLIRVGGLGKEIVGPTGQCLKLLQKINPILGFYIE